MYKNFSYIFGLGALLMLAACDSGDKKSSDGKSVAESQEASTAVAEERQSEKISQNEQGSVQNTAEENQVDEYEGIYADINRPIEEEVPVSARNGNVGVKATNIKGTENEKIPAEDNVVVSKKEESKDAQSSSSDITAEAAAKSDVETQDETSKAKDNLKADAENHKDNANAADSTDVAGNRQSDTNEKHIDANKGNVENSSETPEVSMESDTPTISEESTENSSETPEVSMVSDAPTISEESPEDKSVETDRASESEQKADSEPAEDNTEN